LVINFNLLIEIENQGEYVEVVDLNLNYNIPAVDIQVEPFIDQIDMNNNLEVNVDVDLNLNQNLDVNIDLEVPNPDIAVNVDVDAKVEVDVEVDYNQEKKEEEVDEEGEYEESAGDENEIVGDYSVGGYEDYNDFPLEEGDNNAGEWVEKPEENVNEGGVQEDGNAALGGDGQWVEQPEQEVNQGGYTYNVDLNANREYDYQLNVNNLEVKVETDVRYEVDVNVNFAQINLENVEGTEVAAFKDNWVDVNTPPTNVLQVDANVNVDLNANNLQLDANFGADDN
jgi:hypothetical protein